MAKGNYTALQQLKPTEIKVGELYNKWVDGYVKNGEAERAAQAKMLAEQKKSAQEMVAKIDPKIFTTLQSFQPQTNEIFNSILENKSLLGRMADSGKLDSEFYNLKSKTDNLASQYLQLSTIVTNPQFLEADKKINEQIQEGDIFEGDENMGRWMSIKSGMAQLKANPNTGNIEVVYNDNIKSTNTDRPAKIEQLHEFASKYSSGVSKDLSADIQDKLKAVGTAASTSTNVNRDGITTVTRKAFDMKAATNTITQLMGLDPNVPVEEQFTNVNNLTPFAKQYFYKNGRFRFPESGEDLKVLVNDAVNYAKGYADTAYGSVTSESAADREQQKWAIANAKKNYFSQPSGGSATAQNMNIPSEGEYRVQVKDAKGNIVGFKSEITSVLPIASNQFVGLSNSKDKKGNYYNSYKIGEKGGNGEIIFGAPINQSQFESYIRSQKKNPITVLGQLKSNVSTVNVWNPNLYQKVAPSDIKTNPYTSIKIGTGSNNEYMPEAIGGYTLPQP